jgi:hypothetical protein
MSSGEVVMLVLLLRGVETAVGYWIGKSKGRPVEGLVLGLLLGVIGWIVLWLMRPIVTQPTDPRLIATASEHGATYPAVAAEHPESYPLAVAVLAEMHPPPAHPDAWLTELCRRVDSGHDLRTSAGRIPLELEHPISRPVAQRSGTTRRGPRR